MDSENLNSDETAEKPQTEVPVDDSSNLKKENLQAETVDQGTEENLEKNEDAQAEVKPSDPTSITSHPATDIKQNEEVSVQLESLNEAKEEADEEEGDTDDDNDLADDLLLAGLGKPEDDTINAEFLLDEPAPEETAKKEPESGETAKKEPESGEIAQKEPESGEPAKPGDTVRFVDQVPKKKPEQARKRPSIKSAVIDLPTAPHPSFSGEETRRFTLTSMAPDSEIFKEWSEQAEIDEDERSRRSVRSAASKEEQRIDRNVYYELHEIFNARYKKEKMKSNFLNSVLAAYYIRRNMQYVLREPQFHAEMQKKYERDLDVLDQLMEEAEREKQMCTDDIYHMKTKRDVKKAELNELFEKLQQQELEYGKGLTFEKTGRHNMDKIVERFTKRQKTQMALTIKLRSKYIKLLNKFNEKTQQLESLDNLGPGFRIMDYVQLKTDNRNLHDKLEEKEMELARIRSGCQNNMQVLAHTREKSAVIDLDIQSKREELEEVNMDYEDARTNLHYMKEERNRYRKATKTLRLKNSLYVNKKLLRDMEESLLDVEKIKNEVEATKAECEEKEHQIRMVRKNIHYTQYLKHKEQELLEQEQKNKLRLDLSDSGSL